MSEARCPMTALGALAKALDDDVAAGSAGPVPLLVRAEGPIGVGVQELEVRPIDRHPGELLLGFAAPPEWSLLGVVVEGWAASMPSQCATTEEVMVGGWSASHAADRRRVRTTHLVASDGSEAGVVSVEGNEAMLVGAAEGLLADVLRRCLGLATPAPTVGVAAYFGSFWLAEICHHVQVERRRVTWRELQRLHPALRLLETDPECRNVSVVPAARAFHKVCGWEQLRWQVVCGNWLGTGVDPSVAAWMDEGSFARHLLTGRLSATELLADVTPHLSASVARRLRATLRSWGLFSADAPGTGTGDAA